MAHGQMRKEHNGYSKEVNMYYYEIQDVNGIIIKQSVVPYDTSDSAANAGKDELVTMYVPGYPVEMRIYDRPPDDPLRYISSTYYLSKEAIEQHALKRVEEANRAELLEITRKAVANSDYYKSMWEEGKMTPADFAGYMKSLWAEADYEIKSKEA